MNYYENKQLQDRESHLIGAGIVFIICGLPIAAILAAVVTVASGSASSLPFYGLWAAIELFGVLTIAAAIKEKNERKRNQHS